MPNIDGLKAWAEYHPGSCAIFDENSLTGNLIGNPCDCDVPLKQKLVAFVEAFRDLDPVWQDVDTKLTKHIFEKFKDLEDA